MTGKQKILVLVILIVLASVLIGVIVAPKLLKTQKVSIVSRALWKKNGFSGYCEGIRYNH